MWNIEKAPLQNNKSYNISISRQHDIEQLLNSWQSIEKQYAVPFFLSRDWISCWLKTYDPSIIVVSAEVDNDPVAIGLFTQSTEIRHGLIRSRQIRLHQTGDLQQDQIWIEYNNFICLPGYGTAPIIECLRYFINHVSGWDEIVLRNVPESLGATISSSIKPSRLDDPITCYALDLDSIRRNNSSYLDSLGRNTRYQINRAARLYEKKFGSICINMPENQYQAIEWLHKAGRFHQSRWGNSGFKNPEFVRFHETLISGSFDEQRVQIIKVSAGAETLAIIYYFVSDLIAYFYLQGVRREIDNRLKPGLLSHAMAIQFFSDQGFKEYNFMGGDSQYKRQLSQKSMNLTTVIIKKGSLLFDIEEIARNIKRTILKSF